MNSLPVYEILVNTIAEVLTKEIRSCKKLVHNNAKSSELMATLLKEVRASHFYCSYDLEFLAEIHPKLFSQLFFKHLVKTIQLEFEFEKKIRKQYNLNTNQQNWKTQNVQNLVFLLDFMMKNNLLQVSSFDLVEIFRFYLMMESQFLQ